MSLSREGADVQLRGDTCRSHAEVTRAKSEAGRTSLSVTDTSCVPDTSWVLLVLAPPQGQGVVLPVRPVLTGLLSGSVPRDLLGAGEGRHEPFSGSAAPPSPPEMHECTQTDPMRTRGPAVGETHGDRDTATSALWERSGLATPGAHGPVPGLLRGPQVKAHGPDLMRG